MYHICSSVLNSLLCVLPWFVSFHSYSFLPILPFFSCCLILTLIKPLNQNNTWLTLRSTLFYLNKLPSRNEYLSVHWPWQQMRSAWCYNVPDNSDTLKHGLTSVLEMITSEAHAERRTSKMSNYSIKRGNKTILWKNKFSIKNLLFSIQTEG